MLLIVTGMVECREGASVEQITPKFDNPYPPPGWSSISRYQYHSDLVLLRLADTSCLQEVSREEQYIIAEPFHVSFYVDDEERHIIVPAGMLTDLVSVPRFARVAIGRVGRHLESCIVHDFLYLAWQDLPDMRLDDNGDLFGDEAATNMRLFADKLMDAGMEGLNLGWKRSAIYRAVRLAGWATFLRHDDFRYVDLSSAGYVQLKKKTEGEPGTDKTPTV